MVYLFALGIALAIWENISGLRDGEISGLGQVYVKARRETQPIRFWFIFSFNSVFLIAFVVLFFHELKP